MSMGTNELIKQLDQAFSLCDQRTKDLELAARELAITLIKPTHFVCSDLGQTLLQTNAQLTHELEELKVLTTAK